MSQNCDCNDYSLLTAVTGIAAISTANSSLTGSGSIMPVITGESKGTLVKSVIIKATQPVTDGMVRLFVGPDVSHAILYKEIPIPNTPELVQTPTPAPILQTFEINLAGGLKLAPSTNLYASTQNGESFNVIAEGLNWTYPATLPDSCCNYKQEIAISGHGTVSVANTNTNGSGAIVNIFTATASTNGAKITAITIKALQSTNLGMIRFYVSPDGSTWSLLREVLVPQTEQSGFQPSFKVVLDECYNLEQGFSIGASTHIGQSFGISVEGASWTYPIS